VLLCDIIIVGENTHFGTPKVKIAAFAGDGGTQRIPRTVGKTRAMMMALAGEPFDARTASEWGLAAEVVPTDLTIDRALEIAGKIKEMTPIATQTIKAEFLMTFQKPLDEGLNLERQFLLWQIEDHNEGIAAFVEKRKNLDSRAGDSTSLSGRLKVGDGASYRHCLLGLVAGQKLSIPRLTLDFAVLEDGLATTQNRFGPTLEAHPFIGRIIDVVVQEIVGNGQFAVGASSDDSTWKVPLPSPSQITCWFSLSCGGGLHMHLAPSNPGFVEGACVQQPRVLEHTS